MDIRPKHSTIRTQIPLTPNIKRAKELNLLAQNFVGAGKWKKTHTNWKDKSVVRRWHKSIRNEWK